ncbi:MAG: hypothetical protein ABIF19_04265 [Planctomycetota bacterium]
MVLTSDHIESIRQSAGKLEGWAGNLSYGTSPEKNLLVELTLSFYPHNLDATVSRLGTIPTIGKKVRRDFEELCELIQKVDAWHGHGVYREEMDDFIALINRLRKIALNIVSTLREVSDAGASEAPVTKTIPLEKSKPSEMREAKPVRPLRGGADARRPDEVALMAYKLHHMGLTQLQVAKRMAGELKLETPIRGWTVARWIKQVESYYRCADRDF